VARRRRAGRVCACGALAARRAARSTRTLDVMWRAMSVAFGLLALTSAFAAEPPDSVVDIHVTPTQVDYDGQAFKCLSQLAQRIWNLDRSHEINVSTVTEGLTTEAVKVATMLRNLGFTRVNYAVPPSEPAFSWNRRGEELKTCGPTTT
jgi:hypothetical protein